MHIIFFCDRKKSTTFLRFFILFYYFFKIYFIIKVFLSETKYMTRENNTTFEAWQHNYLEKTSNNRHLNFNDDQIDTNNNRNKKQSDDGTHTNISKLKNKKYDSVFGKQISASNEFMQNSSDLKIDNPHVLRQPSNHRTYKYNSNLSRKELIEYPNSSNQTDENINKIIGKLVSYRKNSDEKRETLNQYMSAPQLYPSGNKDIDTESFLTIGKNTKTTKSNDYKNTFSHRLDFVTGKKQLPIHCVSEFPEATRLQNKTFCTKYTKREI